MQHVNQSKNRLIELSVLCWCSDTKSNYMDVWQHFKVRIFFPLGDPHRRCFWKHWWKNFPFKRLWQEFHPHRFAFPPSHADNVQPSKLWYACSHQHQGESLSTFVLLDFFTDYNFRASNRKLLKAFWLVDLISVNFHKVCIMTTYWI